MFTLVGRLLRYMWQEGVTKWYQSMVHPLDWMGDVLVMHSCQLHICVMYSYVIGACCTCMVLVMVAIMLSWVTVVYHLGSHLCCFSFGKVYHVSKIKI